MKNKNEEIEYLDLPKWLIEHVGAEPFDENLRLSSSDNAKGYAERVHIPLPELPANPSVLKRLYWKIRYHGKKWYSWLKKAHRF